MAPEPDPATSRPKETAPGLDPRGVAEGGLRQDADTHFPRTQRSLLVRLHEAKDYDHLWTSLLEIYWQPLAKYYHSCAGTSAFPRLATSEPEEVIHDYFLERVRRADFHEGSLYGKWLAWRQRSDRAASKAIHFRHWIRADLRNWCRDRADAERNRARRERPFFADEELALANVADDRAVDRQMARDEVEAIVGRAVSGVLRGYPLDRRQAIEAILSDGRDKNVIAHERGISAALARQWWHRFLDALRPELARVLREVGYDSDQDIRGLLEDLA